MFKRYSYIGLDVGSSHIKAVQLHRKNKSFYLYRYLVEETPGDILAEGKILDPDLLVDRLSLLAKKASFRGRRVASSLRRENVTLRRLTLPRMSPRELKEAMKFQVQKEVNIPLEELVFDYIPLNGFSGNQEEGKEQELLLAVASRQVVEGYLEVLEEAGFQPAALEVEVLALLRTFSFYFKRRDYSVGQGNYILLDLGEENTSLIILEEGKYSFHRYLSLGSSSFLKGVREAYGITKEKALEKIKGESLSRLEGARQAAEELAEEVQRTLNYYLYRREYQNISWEGIFFTGGISTLGGLDACLSRELNMSAQPLNSLNYVKVNKKFSGNPSLDLLWKDRGLINTAVGLALGRWDNGKN